MLWLVIIWLSVSLSRQRQTAHSSSWMRYTRDRMKSMLIGNIRNSRWINSMDERIPVKEFTNCQQIVYNAWHFSVLLFIIFLPLQLHGMNARNEVMFSWQNQMYQRARDNIKTGKIRSESNQVTISTCQPSSCAHQTDISSTVNKFQRDNFNGFYIWNNNYMTRKINNSNAWFYVNKTTN